MKKNHFSYPLISNLWYSEFFNMIDFTSSLYLNMKHESSELMKWGRITTAVPAALYETQSNKEIGQRLAQMQGLEMGVLSPSTLHLYWDLYGYLSKQEIVVFIDEAVYPVSKYGIDRLMVSKTLIYPLKHQNIDHLAEIINQKLTKNSTPVIITDGWCTGCGKPAPIQRYTDLIRPFNGKVVIDDTQAFGILGEGKQNGGYGINGCGILKWLNINNPGIITIISLAKGFGVPLAIISGSSAFISEYIENSETRTYSSPVSTAHIHAGLNALKINFTSGENRRRKLLNNILLINKEMNKIGIQLTGGIFPVQYITNLSSRTTIKLHKKLMTERMIFLQVPWSKRITNKNSGF